MGRTTNVIEQEFQIANRQDSENMQCQFFKTTLIPGLVKLILTYKGIKGACAQKP